MTTIPPPTPPAPPSGQRGPQDRVAPPIPLSYQSPTPGTGGSTIVRQAAVCSCMAPLIAFTFNTVSISAEVSTRFYIAIVGFGLYFLGLCCGIYALANRRKDSKVSTTVFASIGIAVNSLILLAVAAVVMLAMVRRL